MTIVNIAEQHSNLVNLLQYRALYDPHSLMYTYLDDTGKVERTFTIADLDRKARAIASTLLEMGKPGDHVLLLYPSGLDFVAAFFGCLYAGMIAVPTSLPHFRRPSERIQAIVTDSQASIALTTSKISDEIKKNSSILPYLSILRFKATDLISDISANEFQEKEISADMIAFQQYTSGSTSKPKGVMVTHRNLLHNLFLMEQNFKLSSETKAVSWLPAYHDMGLIGKILLTPYLGSQLVMMSPVSFMQRPLKWLQTISKYGATYSGGPNFAYELCVQKFKPEQVTDLDLSSWRVALNGAEPIRLETLKKFAECYAPYGFREESIMPGYGLAEGTLYVSACSRDYFPITLFVDAVKLEQNQVKVVSETTEEARALIGCGHVYTGQKVAIVDPETLVNCTDLQVGEIWVSGPSICKGYWNNPEKTAETFEAYIKDTGEGPFLRTGDSGFIMDGELFVTGRMKDLIIIRGRNHYPQDIELTVQKSSPAIRDEYVAAFSVEVDGEERLVVVAELNRDYRPRGKNENLEDQNESDEAVLLKKVATEVRKKVVEVHEIQLYKLILIKTGTISKTSSGKIQRHASKIKYLENNFEAYGCF
ncbi:fatty acyl-AMP ligase [Peribacillus frigoritolerans]|jgi:acyl-CoA synthetase (AMP-forming)/AMP-acid ligase II|uniref:fatty acyl-AMP ligase n=1 Tax=Peribacillus frigoritolerans TaxID=450367 RepID=UPI002079291D|nr:fatty acyl-AMP ligase [Peribacillus frigoritolerans]USK74422.1 fatty acyl-AMP ligase [Peribacillus frigoritolerans]